MYKLTIVANITDKSDKIDLVKSELEKLIDVTLNEMTHLAWDLGNTRSFRMVGQASGFGYL